MSFSESGKFQSPIGRRVVRVFFSDIKYPNRHEIFCFQEFSGIFGKISASITLYCRGAAKSQSKNYFRGFGDIYTDFDDTEQKLTLQKSNFKIIHSRIKIYNQS